MSVHLMAVLATVASRALSETRVIDVTLPAGYGTARSESGLQSDGTAASGLDVLQSVSE